MFIPVFVAMKACVTGYFFSVFLVLFSYGEAKERIEISCPVMLPDGPALFKDVSEGQERIVNGYRASKLHPYMGALKSYGELVCSATLISKYWALTAAHCLFDPKITTFVTGGKNFNSGVEIEIEKGVIHELYPKGSETNIVNDIQLIKLKRPAPPTAKFVKLNTNPSVPASFSFVRTAGFGETKGTAFPKSGVLRQVDVPVQPINLCKEQYKGINIFESYHICAGYVRGGCDSCSGDSGGPLFVFDRDLNIVQIGIVSFGFECAAPNASGVYSKISSQIDWLRRKGAQFQTSSHGFNFFADSGIGSPLNGEILNIDPNKNDRSENSSDALETEPESTTEEMRPQMSSPSTMPEKVPQESQNESPNGAFSDSSSTGECFPSNTSIFLEDSSSKQICDLQIGDSVQVGPGQFSKVFMFTHQITQGTYEFVKISNFVSNDSLLLTPGHILPINGVYQQAGMAKAGDIVELGDGRRAEITTVELVMDNGLCNPQTVAGTLVVNGVVASTYTTALEIRTAHAVLAPLRCAFAVSGWDFSGGVLEQGFPSIPSSLLILFGSKLS